MEELKQAISKTEDVIQFYMSWIQDLQTKQEEAFDFDRQEKIYSIEFKINAQSNLLKAQKQDFAYKVVEMELPSIVEKIDTENLNPTQKRQLKELKKRVIENKYKMFEHKAQDYQLANDLLSHTLQS